MAFTLVELLVVIAIIVILAALAFPITTSMIERGNTTKCVNNLRQIGGAIGQYMLENEGYLPYSASYKYGATSGDFTPRRSHPPPRFRRQHGPAARQADSGIWNRRTW